MGNKGTRRVSRLKSPLWAKFLLGAGVLLLVTSAATGSYAKIMIDRVNNSVDTECLLNDCDAKPADKIKGPLNFLMVGSDMRKDWSEAHSDSIMIMHVNKKLTKANIVSIPRDLYVKIQDCGDLYDSPCQSKVNDAFAVGGHSAKAAVQNLATTLSDLVSDKSGKEFKFDGAAMVNFDGFTDVIDILGSVELCLPFDMEVAHSKNENYELGPNGGRIYPKGCKDYKKSDALGIVRERYSYGPETQGWTEEWGIGDFGRQHMQQHFIKQLMKKAKEEGYVSDPSKVGTLIDEVGSHMRVDLGNQTVTDFAFALRNIDPSSLTTLRVPSESAEIEGTSYVVTQEGEQQQAASSLYKSLREDTLDDWVSSNKAWVNSSE